MKKYLTKGQAMVEISLIIAVMVGVCLLFMWLVGCSHVEYEAKCRDGVSYSLDANSMSYVTLPQCGGGNGVIMSAPRHRRRGHPCGGPPSCMVRSYYNYETNSYWCY